MYSFEFTRKKHEILKVASERAIRCGREKIDRELLHDLDWVLPLQRAREAARMASMRWPVRPGLQPDEYRISQTTSVSVVTQDYIDDGRSHNLQDKQVPWYVAILRVHGPFLFGNDRETRGDDC